MVCQCEEPDTSSPSYLVNAADPEPERTALDTRSIHVVSDEQDKLVPPS